MAYKFLRLPLTVQENFLVDTDGSKVFTGNGTPASAEIRCKIVAELVNYGVAEQHLWDAYLEILNHVETFGKEVAVKKAMELLFNLRHGNEPQ